jgi:hypothetical protein
MTAGLSYQIWLISRAFLSGANYLPWIKNIKLEDKVHKKSGRKSMIADYAFYLSSYFILLHEISHVVLGHCDFVKDEMGFDALNEYEDEIKKEEIPEYDIKIRHAFEVEADRQAGEFLVGFFEESLGKGGLGKKIKFPSKKHAYEFYTYTITLICVLIQQLGLRRGNIHPKPNVRQYIILSSVKEYFDKVGFPDHKVITDNIVLKMLEAAKKTGLLDAESPKQMIFNAILLGEVDDIKKDINIKDYQFTVI